MANGQRIWFVLIDKQPGHVRKVMLFRPAVGEEEIMILDALWVFRRSRIRARYGYFRG
jgi:hypothetical protein